MNRMQITNQRVAILSLISGNGLQALYIHFAATRRI